MSDPRPFEDLRSTGLLWLINRIVFHPRGYALALHRDDDGTITGWSMLGDGSDLWRFDQDADKESFAIVTAYFNGITEHSGELRSELSVSETGEYG
jgi:hypothetical protein